MPPSSLRPTPPAEHDQDPGVLALDGDVPLTPDEAEYVQAARAANTVRGYRSDWREWISWCAQHGYEPLPAP